MKKIASRWLVLATAAILAVSAGAAIWLYANRKNGAAAKIFVDGAVVREVDLGADVEFDVETKYGVNRVKVEGGRIRVISADCPDKTCVNMGWRSDDLVPIACLPHHLVIRVGGESGVDAVAGVAP